MKLIPCGECRQPVLIRRKPSDLFLVVGQMFDPVLTGACLRCKKPFRITSAEFGRLPEMTWKELKAPTCDINTDALIDEAHDEAYELDLFKSSFAPPPPSDSFLTILRSSGPGLRADIFKPGPLLTEAMVLEAARPPKRRPRRP